MVTNTIDESTPCYTRFVSNLFGESPIERGRIVVHNDAAFERPRYFDSPLDLISRLPKCSRDVYALIGLTNSQQATSRGDEGDVIALPALHADIDCYGGKGPESIEQAIEILDSLPHRPNMLVNSGGGIHAYWIFDSPWYFETTAEAKNLLYGWWYFVAQHFQAVNPAWRLDNTAQLNRVLRIPGFGNSKHAGRISTLLRHDARRFSPEDFTSYSRKPEPPKDGKDIEIVDIEIDPATRAKLEDTKTRLGQLWAQDGAAKPKKDDSQSGWDNDLIIQCIRDGIVDDSLLAAIIKEYRATYCTDEKKAAKGETNSYRKRTIARAKEIVVRTTRATAEEDFEPLPGFEDAKSKNPEEITLDDLSLPKKASVATKMLRYIETQGWELWVSTTDDNAYVSVNVNGHLEHHKIASTETRRIIRSKWSNLTKSSISDSAVKEIVDTLEANAHSSETRYATPSRIGRMGDDIYIDLVNAKWQAIRVSGGTWEIVDNPPIRFRRQKSFRPLVAPVKGGSVDGLWRFVRVQSEADRALVLAWLLGCYLVDGPFAIMAFAGEMGAGKSQTIRTLRELVDPHGLAIRTYPKTEQDLHIAAKNSYVLAYDNLSGLPQWFSDGLCRLSTGGGFGTRQLYTDDEEIVLDFKRPLLIGSISDVVTKPDLRDRTLTVRLERIPEADRKAEEDLHRDFQAVAGSILGALLDAVAIANETYKKIKPAKPHRLFDWHRWACAGLPTLGISVGQLEAALAGVEELGRENVIEASREAQALIRMFANSGVKSWSGTGEELRRMLDLYWTDRRTDVPNANTLSGRLTALRPDLKATGWKIDRGTGRDRRKWFIEAPVDVLDVGTNGDESAVEDLF